MAVAVATLATRCSYHFNSPVPNHASILIHPIHLVLVLMLERALVVAAVVAACHLMEFAAYALRMPGIILSTATFRFLWNLRLSFGSSSFLVSLSHSLARLLVCFLLPLLLPSAFCSRTFLKTWHAACLTKSFCRLPFVLRSLPHTLGLWKLTRFYWPSFDLLVVFFTLSNFEFVSAFCERGQT